MGFSEGPVKRISLQQIPATKRFIWWLVPWGRKFVDEDNVSGLTLKHATCLVLYTEK